MVYQTARTHNPKGCVSRAEITTRFGAMKTLYGGQLRRQQVVGSRWSSAGGHHCCITGLTVNVEELSHSRGRGRVFPSSVL